MYLVTKANAMFPSLALSIDFQSLLVLVSQVMALGS